MALCLVVLWGHGAVLSAAAGPGSVPVEAVFDAIAAEQGGACPAQAGLITDNQEAWYARWFLVNGATRSIDCSYFDTSDDIFAVSFLGLLLKKAREGVSIRLMLDFRGAALLLRSPLGQQYLRDLAGAGKVQVRIYNPLFKSILRLFGDPRGVIAANHDKLLIVDREWLFTGGRNLTHDYLCSLQDDPEAIHDKDLLLRGGEIATSATRAFEAEFSRRSVWKLRPGLLDFWSERTEDLELMRRAMDDHMRGIPPARNPEPGSLSRAVLRELSIYKHLTGYGAYAPLLGAGTHPAVVLRKQARHKTPSNEITGGLARLMGAAREEILLESPYVVLTAAGRRMLRQAGERGVRIILVTTSPETGDSILPQIPLIYEWKQLLKEIPNLRIFATRGRNLLHSKVFVIDRAVAVVGSYNLDTLSEQVNCEEVVVTRSGDLARQVASSIEDDRARSLEYKVRTLPDGTVVEVQGPKDLISPAVWKRLPLMRWITWLRPIL
ncbi:MAG: phosphatidylserine/phosphatidylglycerophosphate/cardiolipin synthase family protein [Candidatus Riflebacteria bacterium]|nr:phosphatidylserine/phosphatidylglycerophosphate/cardiolipin synthase family protein [Candidatus Riflebacteria bacterium]